MERFDCQSLPSDEAEVPIRFLNELAEVMARKEHAEDEALRVTFQARRAG